MREILFRGMTTTKEWICGYYVHRPDIATDVHFIVSVNSFNTIMWYQVIPETVGQFIGLTDKNGKRIFEGDICTYPDGWVDYAGDGVETFSVGVVTWYNEHPCFYLTENIGIEWDEIWDSVAEITVIGNIHDSPELLEG